MDARMDLMACEYYTLWRDEELAKLKKPLLELDLVFTAAFNTDLQS